MKKLLILTLVLLSFCATALAAPGDTTLLAQPDDVAYELRPYAMTADGDTLYIAAGETLYQWKMGDETPTALGEGLIHINTRWSVAENDPEFAQKTRYCLDKLLFDGGKLYGLNMISGVLFEIGWQDGKITYANDRELDTSFMSYQEGEYTQNCELDGLALQNGKLYLLAHDYLYNEESWRFYAVDVESGKAEKLEAEFPYRLAGGKDGKLLLGVYDEQNSWDEERQQQRPMEFVLLDPATMETTPAFTVSGNQSYNTTAITYDAATDAYYFFQPNRVMKAQVGGEAEIAGYLPVSYTSGRESASAMLTGGYFALNTSDGVFIRNLDPAHKPEFTLTVYGGGGYENAHKKAQAEIGNIPVLFSETYYSNMQELSQAMVSGESDIDVLALDLQYQDVQQLMSKGYCADLSGNAEIMAFVDTLYPNIAEAMKLDGKLMAIPTRIDMWGLCKAPEKTWAEVGLEDEIPTNYLELFEFITTWAEDYIEEYPTYQPMENESYKSSLFYELMDQYSNYCQAEGIDLTLDTPLFRELLAAYEAMEPGDLELNIDWESPDAEAQYEQIWNRTTLMPTGYSYVLPDARDYGIPLPLPLTADTEIHLPLSVSVLVVNPRSKHLDAAIAYVAAYARGLDERVIVAMCPDKNEPIENPNYADIIKNLTDFVEKQKAALETCEPGEREEIQENIARVEENLAESEENYRYSVSPKSIELHRELMQYTFIARPTVLQGENSEEFYTLYNRYMDGQIDAEQFIREGSAKLRLMHLENK